MTAEKEQLRSSSFLDTKASARQHNQHMCHHGAMMIYVSSSRHLLAFLYSIIIND
jgi:hypothetical protein